MSRVRNYNEKTWTSYENAHAANYCSSRLQGTECQSLSARIPLGSCTISLLEVSSISHYGLWFKWQRKPKWLLEQQLAGTVWQWRLWQGRMAKPPRKQAYVHLCWSCIVIPRVHVRDSGAWTNVTAEFIARLSCTGSTSKSNAWCCRQQCNGSSNLTITACHRSIPEYELAKLWCSHTYLFRSSAHQ